MRSEVTLQITIENLAPQQGSILTPVWVATHDGSFDTFDEGKTASSGIELVAEEGLTGLEATKIPNFG